MRHESAKRWVGPRRIPGFRRWMVLVATLVCLPTASARTAIAGGRLAGRGSQAPARARQFGPRAVGGSWKARVAERLDALAAHTRRLAVLRGQDRGSEPSYSRAPAAKPASLPGAARAELRR